ncbi:MAG: hypothetical protein AB1779_05270 [Candidatus Thermoplasmatota archaeon]
MKDWSYKGLVKLDGNIWKNPKTKRYYSEVHGRLRRTEKIQFKDMDALDINQDRLWAYIIEDYEEKKKADEEKRLLKWEKYYATLKIKGKK